MKNTILILLVTLGAFFFLGSLDSKEPIVSKNWIQRVFAQGDIRLDPASPPKQGCEEVDVHCVCQNPERDFWVRNHKIRVQSTSDEPECWTRLDIEEFLKRGAIALCLRTHGGQRDPRKPQTSCQASYVCKKPCTIKTDLPAAGGKQPPLL